MSWYRNTAGLWCAYFLAYQPDDGAGCPAYPCPEAEDLPSPRTSTADGLYVSFPEVQS